MDMGELMTVTSRDNSRDNSPQAVGDKGTTGTKPFRVVPFVPAVPTVMCATGADTFDHDLTGIFNSETAAMIADAWTTARDGLDPQPIREHYRAVRHAGFRAVIAQLMGART